MNRFSKCLAAGLMAAFAAGAMAAKTDLDYQRLSQSLNKLEADPTLGHYAGAERALARQAVDALRDASGKRREYVLYMAERRVDLAQAAAELADSRHKLQQLQREHDKILLQASRRDAAATRQALERERLQNQLAAEQADRLQAEGLAFSQAAEKARAEADQAHKFAQSQSRAAAAARHEAELAESAVRLMRQQMDHMQARQGSEGMQMTVGGAAFATGQTALRPEAKSHLGNLVQFVKSKPGKRIRIEGYTDSSGNAAVNQSISLKRAQSVGQALVEKGIDASRISTVGMGETHPVASNSTAEGRAKNRRVVVILKD